LEAVPIRQSSSKSVVTLQWSNGTRTVLPSA
jgi:hypothetical protein